MILESAFTYYHFIHYYHSNLPLSDPISAGRDSVRAAGSAGSSGCDAFGDGDSGVHCSFFSPPGDSGKMRHSMVDGYRE